ncbi:MAG TPA: gamma-glutamyl-gamma-aminobutyrate hydrolase family protein [Phycisphaerales bacterium]|nr:gamma-glutamyl-gamma-aminobutyrate hydrolase family protein [Phycisphaerales bacterium]
MSRRRPLVGITADLAEHPNGVRVFSYTTYASAVESAGGIPVLLAPAAGSAAELAGALDAFVLSGGDDPRTESFGEPTHPRATPVHPERQEFETALLRVLESDRADTPVLGVCLGMQMMALVGGGRLDQHLPDRCPTHALHWERDHAVEPTEEPGAPGVSLRGVVRSKHRQAVMTPGRLRIVAASPDGIVEALTDPARRFYLGVQWHPERTADHAVGAALFEALVAAAR